MPWGAQSWVLLTLAQEWHKCAIRDIYDDSGIREGSTRMCFPRTVGVSWLALAESSQHGRLKAGGERKERVDQVREGRPGGGRRDWPD